MPLAFEPNKGQTHPDVQFFSRGDGYTFYLMPTTSVMLLRKGATRSSGSAALRVSLLNANPDSTLSGNDKLAATSNYFKGSASFTNVENYARVRSNDVYPGVDLVYYGNNRQLEYDFVVAPHADPSAIHFALEGADSVELDETGDLVLHFDQGIVRHKKPVIYQETGGERVPVEGSYVLNAEQGCGQPAASVSFALGDYDHSKTLVIDPILRFSCIFGDKPNLPGDPSDHSGDEGGNGIAIDSTGNIYVTGFTNSIEFEPLEAEIIDRIDPNHGPSHPEFDYDAFVTKFNSDLSEPIYSTYLGGSTVTFLSGTNIGNDIGIGIVVDSTFSPYITGNTFASDFPVKNALSTYSGNGDAFITKLTPSGGDILFSTYLGGSGLDSVNGIALDSSQNIYVVGTTASTNFRIANAIQPFFGGGATDGFAAKLNSDGSVLLYSSFMGGSGDDAAMGVTADASGSAYICGFTNATNFPIANALQVIKGAGFDGFVTKLNSSGNLKIFSTYLGGDADDQANAIVIDATGNIYVTGNTASSNFPTVSPTILPVQTANGGLIDAFVTKYDRFGASLIFSTYLGGSGNDNSKAIAVDSRNAIYIAGVTNSPDFPVSPSTNTLQPGLAGGTDGFLAKFNPTGVPLVYATYYGSDTHYFITDNDWIDGTGFDPFLSLPAPVATNDEVRCLVADNAGNAYIAGLTNGGFYHTFGAFSTGDDIPGTTGEDFPAPFTRTTTDPDLVHSDKNPAEAGAPRDLNDAYTSVILDSSPIITSPNTAQGTLGANFNYTITATNDPQNFNAAGLPPGLSISTSTGQIAGVPQTTGNFKVVLSASNPSGTGAQMLFLNISTLPPVINSPLTASGRVGDVFQYTISATNDPGTFTANGLPSGLTLDSTIGLISGVPNLEGIFPIGLTASNAVGSDSKTLRLTILPAVPVVSSPANAQGVLNQAFTYSITATNNPTSFSASGLPGGLNLDGRTGIISGVPTQLGSFSIVLSASNGGGTGNLTLSLQIIQPVLPVISSPDSATAVINQPFSFTITASNSPLSFGVNDPNALALVGLSVDNVTGVISGVPPTGAASIAGPPFQQTATNSAGTAFKDLTITIVDPPAPVITSPLTVAATAGIAFRYDITATNNPTLFSAAGLPAGLAITTITAETLTGSPQLNGFIASGLIGNTLPLVGKPLQMTSGPDSGQIRLISSFDQSSGTIVLNSPLMALPATGDTFDIQTGVISGTPVAAGSVVATITADNSGGTGLVQRSGTLSSAGVNVTGAGTMFTQQLQVGDEIIAAGQTATVATIIDDTNLTTTVPFAPALANAVYTSRPVRLTININELQPPVITSANIASAIVNIPFTYQIVATNIPTAYSVTGLPAGLGAAAGPGATGALPGGPAINDISGTVSVGSSPTQFTTSSLAALDTAGLDFNGLVLETTITGVLNVRTITSYDATTNPATIRINSPFINNVGTQVSLATGATFLLHGVIFGTPTAAAAGTSSVSLYAQNGSTVNNGFGAGVDMKTLTLNVQTPAVPNIILPPPDPNSGLPTVYANDGAPFPAFLLQATGTQPVAFQAANLPPGLVQNGNVIQGTPTSPITADVVITPFNAATNPTSPPNPPPPGSSSIVPANPPATNFNKVLRIVISATPPTIQDINSNNTVTGTVGVPISMGAVPGVPIQVSGTAPITVTSQTPPPGITFDAAALTFSGIPTAAAVGTIQVTLTATNSIGTGTKTITFKILPQAPVITSPLSASGTDGVPFSYTITATGSPPIALAAANLPDGLSFSGTTITGTPTSQAIGSTSVTLTASNNGGLQVDTKTLVISISPAPALIDSALTATAQEGLPFTYTITAAGTTPFSFTAAPLPPGLTLQGANITGTPTQQGTYNIALGATNAVGGDTRVLVLTVLAAPPLITSSLTAAALDGTPFSYTITASGTSPITFSAVGLPTGLQLNGADITGSAVTPGTFPVTLFAVNSIGSDSRVLILTVVPAPPVITNIPPSSVQGAPGAPFTYRILATGSQPISFAAAGLQQIPGLVISGDTISGTPTAITNGPIAIQLTASNAYGQDQKILAIEIVFLPPTITNPPDNTSILQLRQGIALATNPPTYQVTASGSPAIRFTAANLPPGLSLDINTGILSGAPTTLGTFTTTFTATNDVPALNLGVDSKTLTIIVNASPPVFTSATTHSAIQGVLAAPYVITAAGTVPITFTAAPLPPGITFDAATATLSGTPTATSVTDIRIVATNQAGTTTMTLTYTVSALVPVITSPLAANGIVGVPFTYTITATNIPNLFTASGLPAGLSLTVTPGATGADPATGVISGSPAETGVFNVELTAGNAGGVATATLVLTINTGAPIITSPLNASGTVGAPFNYTIVAFGVSPITFSAAPLPPGLTLSGNTITGVPTQENIFVVTLNASNSIGAETQFLTIVIGPRIDDSDGDGFPDELEIALGTDPANAASTPFNGAPAGPVKKINVTGMQIKLNFSSGGRDTVSVKGTLPLGAGANVAGQSVRVVVGGIARTFSLDQRGSASLPPDKFALRSAKLSEDARFMLKFGPGNFQALLADEGLTNAVALNQSRQVRVFILYKNTVYESRKLTTWNARLNKTGTAKATKPDVQ